MACRVCPKGKQNTAKGVVGYGVSGPKSDSGLIVRKRLTGLATQLKNRAKIVLRGEVVRIARDVVTPERFVDGSRTSHAHAITVQQQRVNSSGW
jgi:hypothetical protein